MSERAWIVVDLVVHSAWSMDEDDAEPSRAWHRLVAALGDGPHQVVNRSDSGKQALIFAVTTDRDAFLRIAREHAPSEGVASFTARVWDVDPRQGGAPPEEIELVEPHAAWPRAGYGDSLMARLSAEEHREPARRGADLRLLLTRFNASIHKLEFEIGASGAPFEPELTRRLAQGALLSVRALRQVAPSELTALVEEAETALKRVRDALGDDRDQHQRRSVARRAMTRTTSSCGRGRHGGVGRGRTGNRCRGDAAACDGGAIPADR